MPGGALERGGSVGRGRVPAGPRAPRDGPPRRTDGAVDALARPQRLAGLPRAGRGAGRPPCPRPRSSTFTSVSARLNAAWTVRTASAVSRPPPRTPMLRELAPWAMARTLMPTLPSAAKKRPATLGHWPIASATRLTSVTGVAPGGSSTSPRRRDSAPAPPRSTARAPLRRRRVDHHGEALAVPDCVTIHAAELRLLQRREHPHRRGDASGAARRDSTARSARCSRLVTQVGRCGSGLPCASMTVPPPASTVLRMRRLSPLCSSGSTVRRWNIRRPK